MRALRTPGGSRQVEHQTMSKLSQGGQAGFLRLSPGEKGSSTLSNHRPHHGISIGVRCSMQDFSVSPDSRLISRLQWAKEPSKCLLQAHIWGVHPPPLCQWRVLSQLEGCTLSPLGCKVCCTGREDGGKGLERNASSGCEGRASSQEATPAPLGSSRRSLIYIFKLHHQEISASAL